MEKKSNNHKEHKEIEKIIDRMQELKIKKDNLEKEYNEKREILLKFFEETQENSLSSKKYTATCVKSLTLTYDVVELEKKLDKKIFDEIIEKEVVIIDYTGFTNLLKKAGIKARELKELIEVRRFVNNEKIKNLFNTNQINLKDLEGCYDAQIKRAIRIKNN